MTNYARRGSPFILALACGGLAAVFFFAGRAHSSPSPVPAAPIERSAASQVDLDASSFALADPSSEAVLDLVRISDPGDGIADASQPGVASANEARIVMANLGTEGWTLTATETTKGAICGALSATRVIAATCFPGFASQSAVLTDSPQGVSSAPFIWGISQPNVVAVGVVEDGTIRAVQTAGRFFFYEGQSGGHITSVRSTLANGSTQELDVRPPSPSQLAKVTRVTQ